MATRDSPQEHLGFCHRFFRLIMDSFAFQSLKRIALGRSRGQYVPIEIKSTDHQNEAHSVVDESFDTHKSFIGVEQEGKLGKVNTMAVVADKEANGLKAMKGDDNDGHNLNRRVQEIKILPVKDPGIVDKEVRIQDKGAATSAAGRGKTVTMNGDALKRDDRKNHTNMSIDAKAEQYIKRKLEHLRNHSTNGSKSVALHKKKSHP